ncbi:helix-turn-helix transcriptional regulator [Nodosilinea sp. P-1105]|uniref:helix-turn-helix domain-containing protein n=1 Tax=Nodosilinea sp. P-1105 TaxID=2546229 RepID=UPI00146E5EBE|nr:helix-turn-helix transcriptional regulator [Nodosilinea sp. P-1105]NMF86604.1 XRE family transcriptional regulator [Nodosilinea sp. P-1105]
MKPGSKYYPLFDHLQHCGQAETTLTFAEIEAMLGRSLPQSARDRKNWWSNRETPGALQSGAWVGASYHVKSVDLDQETVTFGKVQAHYNIQLKDGKVVWQQDAIRALRKHMSLTQMEFSEQLGVRRQTISEWENGVYDPDRSTSKFLELIAKQANFEVPPDASTDEE